MTPIGGSVTLSIPVIQLGSLLTSASPGAMVCNIRTVEGDVHNDPWNPAVSSKPAAVASGATKTTGRSLAATAAGLPPTPTSAAAAASSHVPPVAGAHPKSTAASSRCSSEGGRCTGRTTPSICKQSKKPIDGSGLCSVMESKKNGR